MPMLIFHRSVARKEGRSDKIVCLISGKPLKNIHSRIRKSGSQRNPTLKLKSKQMKTSLLTLLLAVASLLLTAEVNANPVTYRFTATKLYDWGTTPAPDSIEGVVTLDPDATPRYSYEPTNYDYIYYSYHYTGGWSSWENGNFSLEVTSVAFESSYAPSVYYNRWDYSVTYSYNEYLHHELLNAWYPDSYSYDLSNYVNEWKSNYYYTNGNQLRSYTPSDTGFREIDIYSGNEVRTPGGTVGSLPTVADPWTPLADMFNRVLLNEYDYSTGQQTYAQYAITSFEVGVLDTTPPVFTSLTPSPATLLPANGAMISVTLTPVTTDNVGVVSTKIISVTSNEPVDTAADISVTGDLTLKLRASLNPHSNLATGRTYTITAEAADAAGNKTQLKTSVRVPKPKK